MEPKPDRMRQRSMKKKKANQPYATLRFDVTRIYGVSSLLLALKMPLAYSKATVNKLQPRDLTTLK